VASAAAPTAASAVSTVAPGASVVRTFTAGTR
jgi:hypothetical protein